jgi:adenine phosphoribosyltransferase
VNLKTYIRDVEDFPKPGISFKDISPLLGDLYGFQESVDQLQEQWSDIEIDAIAAFDARGFLFGAPLALAMKVPLVPIRKQGKLPYETISESYGLEYGTDVVEMQVDAIKRGDSVLLLDDLLATGGTARAGAKLVEKLGGVVVGCGFVLELEGLPGRDALAGYDVRSLVKYNDG